MRPRRTFGILGFGRDVLTPSGTKGFRFLSALFFLKGMCFIFFPFSSYIA